MYKVLIALLITIFTMPLTTQAAYLCGKVKFVSYGEDYRVKLVTRFADLNVRLVNRFPTKPGLWQKVQYGEDFKVKFVEYNEDFTVCFVDIR